MAASIEPADRLNIGRPEALFDLPAVYPGGNISFDVDADDRFYVVEFNLDSGPLKFLADLVLTRHWVELLEAKLGGRP